MPASFKLSVVYAAMSFSAAMLNNLRVRRDSPLTVPLRRKWTTKRATSDRYVTLPKLDDDHLSRLMSLSVLNCSAGTFKEVERLIKEMERLIARVGLAGPVFSCTCEYHRDRGCPALRGFRRAGIPAAETV
jgi:hypothetical protein